MKIAHGRARGLTRVIAVAIGALAWCGVVCAQDAPVLGQPRVVTGFVIDYAEAHPQHPEVALLDEAEVMLSWDGSAWAPAAQDDEQAERFRIGAVPALERQVFYDAALPLVSAAVVERLQALGLLGVYVEPDPTQLRVVNGRVVDDRPEGATTLRLMVTTSVASDVRTVGLLERVETDETLNNPVHRRIIERSPVQVYQGEEPRQDLLLRDEIDDYIFRLNRQPGRRVDVALSAAGTEPGGVTLDYLVTENRPWLFFAQASNTGAPSTDAWRERFGFIHNDLTNNDDIFTIDYLTANFSDIHALLASYESPVGESERWRYRIFGTWYEYDAEELGQQGADFEGRGWGFGGELIWNFYQKRELFLDAVAGIRTDREEVDNNFAGLEGEENFVLPYAGLRLERETEESRTLGSVTFEFQVADVDQQEVDLLGRTDTDTNWTAMLYDLSHSFYLEPLFTKREDADDLSLAHELYFAVRGQVAFGNRLTPTAQQPVGGLYSVRGYPQSIVAGDSVVAATAEYRYHIPRGMSPDPAPGQFMGGPFRWVPQYPAGPVDWDLILKAFIDVGRVEQSDKLFFERDHDLMGAGVGVELALTRRFNVRAEVAWALLEIDDSTGGTPVDHGHTEFHFVATVIY